MSTRRSTHSAAHSGTATVTVAGRPKQRDAHTHANMTTRYHDESMGDYDGVMYHRSASTGGGGGGTARVKKGANTASSSTVGRTGRSSAPASTSTSLKSKTKTKIPTISNHHRRFSDSPAAVDLTLRRIDRIRQPASSSSSRRSSHTDNPNTPLYSQTTSAGGGSSTHRSRMMENGEHTYPPAASSSSSTGPLRHTHFGAASREEQTLWRATLETSSQRRPHLQHNEAHNDPHARQRSPTHLIHPHQLSPRQQKKLMANTLKQQQQQQQQHNRTQPTISHTEEKSNDSFNTSTASMSKHLGTRRTAEAMKSFTASRYAQSVAMTEAVQFQKPNLHVHTHSIAMEPIQTFPSAAQVGGNVEPSNTATGPLSPQSGNGVANSECRSAPPMRYNGGAAANASPSPTGGVSSHPFSPTSRSSSDRRRSPRSNELLQLVQQLEDDMRERLSNLAIEFEQVKSSKFERESLIDRLTQVEILLMNFKQPSAIRDMLLNILTFNTSSETTSTSTTSSTMKSNRSTTPTPLTSKNGPSSSTVTPIHIHMRESSNVIIESIESTTESITAQLNAIAAHESAALSSADAKSSSSSSSAFRRPIGGRSSSSSSSRLIAATPDPSIMRTFETNFIERQQQHQQQSIGSVSLPNSRHASPEIQIQNKKRGAGGGGEEEEDVDEEKQNSKKTLTYHTDPDTNRRASNIDSIPMQSLDPTTRVPVHSDTRLPTARMVPVSNPASNSDGATVGVNGSIGGDPSLATIIPTKTFRLHLSPTELSRLRSGTILDLTSTGGGGEDGANDKNDTNDTNITVDNNTQQQREEKDATRVESSVVDIIDDDHDDDDLSDYDPAPLDDSDSDSYHRPRTPILTHQPPPPSSQSQSQAPVQAQSARTMLASFGHLLQQTTSNRPPNTAGTQQPTTTTTTMVGPDTNTSAAAPTIITASSSSSSNPDNNPDLDLETLARSTIATGNFEVLYAQPLVGGGGGGGSSSIGVNPSSSSYASTNSGSTPVFDADAYLDGDISWTSEAVGAGDEESDEDQHHTPPTSSSSYQSQMQIQQQKVMEVSPLPPPRPPFPKSIVDSNTTPTLTSAYTPVPSTPVTVAPATLNRVGSSTRPSSPPPRPSALSFVKSLMNPTFSLVGTNGSLITAPPINNTNTNVTRRT